MSEQAPHNPDVNQYLEDMQEFNAATAVAPMISEHIEKQAADQAAYYATRLKTDAAGRVRSADGSFANPDTHYEQRRESVAAEANKPHEERALGDVYKALWQAEIGRASCRERV